MTLASQTPFRGAPGAQRTAAGETTCLIRARVWLAVWTPAARGFLPCLLSILACLLGTPSVARADWNTLLTDGTGISGFELYRNGLGGVYWWSPGPGHCGIEFPKKSTVRLRGWLAAGTANQVNSCEALQDRQANAVRDDDFVYYFKDDLLYYRSIHSSENYDNPFFTDTALVRELGMHLELVGDYFYGGWFDGSSYVYIWRKTRSTSDDPELLCFITDGGAPVQKLKVFSYIDSFGDTIDALAVLLTNGRFYRCVPSDFGDVQLLGTGVTDFAIHNSSSLLGTVTSIYATIGTLSPSPPAPGSYLVRINPETKVPTTLYTASAGNQLLSLTTDSEQFTLPEGGGTDPRNIYFTEAAVTCTDSSCSMSTTTIYRHSLPWTSGAPAPIVSQLFVSGAYGLNLRSDDKTLYYIAYDSDTGLTAIKTNSTSLAPFEFDIQADWLEVVQAIQNSANEVSLVARKEIAPGTGAFVRGYAHLQKNTSGYTWAFPTANLHAYIDGAEIPGSPFAHLNNVSINFEDRLEILRPDLGRSFLFKLPPLPAGNLSLEMTVNPTHAIKETGSDPFANNTATLGKTVSVAERGTICLVMISMPTTVGSYPYGGYGFWEIMQRALTYLPVPEFKLYLLPDDLSLAHDLYFNDITDDDKEDIALADLAKLNCKTKSPCSDTHWVGMLQPGTTWKWGGLAPRPGSELLVKMDSGISSDRPVWNKPYGGGTLAHELGHNYGRQHVDQTACLFQACGATTPAHPDPAYPFGCCCIGYDLPSAWFGLDPITQKVIAPCDSSDLMSYALGRWVSPYTYGALYGGLPAAFSLSPASPLAAAPAAPLPLQQGSPVLLVAGFIDSSRNTARFLGFDQFPDGAADPEKVAMSFAAAGRAANLPDHYLIRLLDSGGASLGETALEIHEPENEPLSHLAFTQFIPFDPQTRRIQLVQGGRVWTERVVSPHAPNLTLNPLTFDAGTQSFQLSWNADDADNDPLEFTVQYSTDDGASWTALRINYPWLATTIPTGRLPGSTQARLRVIASDGANSTLANTPPFVVGSHSPQALISGVVEGERIPFGQDRWLHGLVYDPEDGGIPGSRLSWSVSGPTPLVASGGSISVDELSPGPYVATLFGFDSNQNLAEATRTFDIMPLTVPEGDAPVLDGLCNDATYAGATMVKMDRGDGEFVRVRLVHAGSNLFLSFSDLRLPSAPGSTTAIGLRIDVDASGDALGSPGDVGFFVTSDGIAYQEAGTGTGMAENLSPRRGFIAMIGRGDNGWSAEFQIADALVGGWNHAVGLTFAHDSAHWPPMATDQEPVTWAPAFFGAVPPLPPPVCRWPMEARTKYLTPPTAAPSVWTGRPVLIPKASRSASRGHNCPAQPSYSPTRPVPAPAL